MLLCEPISGSPLCGLCDYSGSGTRPQVVVIVSGEDVTPKVADSIRVSTSLQERGVASFTIIDQTGTRHFDIGETVLVLWDGTRIFGGQISTVEEELPKYGYPPLVSSIEANDWSRTFDRYFVAASYEQKTVKDIAKDIINVQTLIGTEDGITIGTIPGFIISKVVYPYSYVSDCLRDLCTMSGLSWRVTPNKVLEFYDQVGFEAPFTIGDGGRQTYRGLKHSKSSQQYRNSQWITGGKNKTEELPEERFKGDGERRTFTLSYPIAEITSITRDDGSGPVTQRIGVKGTDVDGDVTVTSWAQWFWSPNEKEITQNSASDPANPILGTSGVIVVTYKGYYPVVTLERDETKIAARKAIEGGSGIYEAVQEESDLDSLDLAKVEARRLLVQYGRIPGKLQYEVDEFGLLPGHLQTITLAGHSVTAVQYMVDEVEFTFPGFFLFRCGVSALDGERLDGWVDFWRAAIAAGRKASYRENEVAEKVVGPEETITFTDTLEESVHGSVTIPAATTDPYTRALIGSVTIGSEVIPLWVIGRSKIG
jgi:hypothetical protein